MATDIAALAVAGVRGLRPYEPGKPIEELKREYGISEVAKLASNENPLGPSPRALATAARTLAGVSRYPDGNGFGLKAALARKLDLSSSQITLGNGSNEILELLTRTFVTPENEIVFSQHAFAVYPLVTQAVGAKAVITRARNWGHDLDAMTAAINARTRMVFIANPNNPTGTWLRAVELKAFIQALPGHVLVVVDEAYYEYVEQADYPDTTNWLDGFENLIVTRTFSKAYGLAGLRIGYGISSEVIAGFLNRIRQPFNVNSVALAAAEAALEDTEHLDATRRVNRNGMAQLTQAFEDMGLSYILSVANFVSVDVGRPGADVYEQLLRYGVIVRPVANYEMPHYLRVTIGTEEENARFIEALKIVIGNP